MLAYYQLAKITKMQNTPNPTKTEHQKQVEAFMRAVGQKVPSKPTKASPEVRLLRARLILEEAFETVDGCCDLRVVATGRHLTARANAFRTA